MKIKDISFITPLISIKNYKLDKQYSETLMLNQDDKINLASSIGPKDSQEDTVAVQTNNDYILMLVADGIGGLTNGSKASYITASTIMVWFTSLLAKELKNLDEHTIYTYILKLINIMKENNFPIKGGTTLNMSIIGPKKTFIINIGDSRTYSIKGDKITYQSYDDSFLFHEYNPHTAEERDALRFHIFSNMIKNCIEKRTLTKISVNTINNCDYDILCHITDGISDVLDEKTIRELCLSQNPAQTLVDKAINSELIYNTSRKSPEYVDYIYPHDNASAIVYTKKRRWNSFFK